MNLIKKFTLAFLCSITQLILFAQSTASATAPNDDFMRSNGKIFLVMTIVVLIMSGLLVYLISIDRKISRLEKK